MRKDVLIWIIAIVIGLGVFNAVQVGINSLRKQQSETIISTEAKMTTGRNSFMSTCTSANQTLLTAEQLRSYCGCAWDKIVAMYGDKIVNDLSIAQRIKDSGYTEAETDMFVKCVEPYLE